jgi:small subunit ribosomal protein S18
LTAEWRLTGEAAKCRQREANDQGRTANDDFDFLRSIMADETRPTPSADAPATGGGERTTGGGERRPPYRSSGPGGPREGGGGGGRKFFRRKKVCKFCTEKIEAINYKDVRLLAQFVAESGKITPRRLTGVCTPHQRRLSLAIKQARNIALLPFSSR